MLNQNKPPRNNGADLMSSKPGSEPVHANLPNDFGADVNNATERQYASHAALNQDPGKSQVRSSDERGGRRDAGVGVDATNAGAGSGGDLDPNSPDLAENIPDAAERDARGPDRDRRDGDRRLQTTQPLNATDDVPRGGTVTTDADREADGTRVERGPDAINTTSKDDPYQDAAVGEVSRGESAGPNDSSSSSARR